MLSPALSKDCPAALQAASIAVTAQVAHAQRPKAKFFICLLLDP
jgi:hypothetical protein